MTVAQQVIAVFSGVRGFLDNVELGEIKNLEKISEFYVERRMNASIKTLIEGKGVDDIL